MSKWKVYNNNDNYDLPLMKKYLPLIELFTVNNSNLPLIESITVNNNNLPLKELFTIFC